MERQKQPRIKQVKTLADFASSLVSKKYPYILKRRGISGWLETEGARRYVIVFCDECLDGISSQGRPAFTSSPAINLITGPGMTADIALQTTFGMYGPKNVHIIWVDELKTHFF